MKKPIGSACIGVFLSAVVCAAGCSRPANPAPQAAQPAPAAPAAAQPAAAAPPAAAPAPTAGAAVIASETFSGNSNLRCDLLEVRRVSGGALRVKWRMVNTGAKTIYYNFNWPDLYVVDPAENKKYGFLTDSEGQRILEVFEGDYHAGDQKVQWAKFPAPPPSSTKITVTIPKVAPFEDVPVSQ